MDRNTSIGILFGVGIVVVLAFGLSMFPAQSEDTIILVNKQGTDPVNSCAPGNGLILAQNLTDLCDVVIVSPATNQILRYNGSFWVNVASATFNDTTTCNNIGVGNAFVCVEGTNVDLRSLLNGTGIIVNNDTNTITITNSLPESTVCTNQTTGQGLCINDTIELKNLVPGIGMSLSSSATHITISNTGVVSNLCQTGINCSGTTLATFNTDFANGTGISITGTAPQTFTNTGVLSVISNSNSTIGVVPTTGNVVLYPKYQLLCQTTLSSSNSTISCNAFSEMTHLHVELFARSIGGTGIEPAIRFNGDTGTNYAFRISNNGGADATTTNTSRCNLTADGILRVSGNGIYFTGSIYNNLASDRKLIIGEDVSGLNTADTTAPVRDEITCKWDNTTNRITSITAIAFSGTGSYDTDSQLTVWGYN